MFAAKNKISNLTAATGMSGYKAKKYFKEFLNRNSSLSSLNDLCVYLSLAALHILHPPQPQDAVFIRFK